MVLAVLGSVLAPAAAQAATPRRVSVIQWASPGMERTLLPGQQSVVVAYFRTTRTLNHVIFSVRLNGGLVARPSSFNYGVAVAGRWNALPFVVSVPARAGAGVYSGIVRPERWDGDDVNAFGTPLLFNIRVMPRAPQPLITWTPANLGTVTLVQGQSQSGSAVFVSNVALTSVQVLTGLSAVASARGVSMVFTSMAPNLTTIPAGTPITVGYTVAASASAVPGVYDSDLHLLGSVHGAPVIQLWHDDDVRIVVTRPTPLVTWSPGLFASYPTVTRGTTATVTAAETAAFAVNMAVINASLVGSLNSRAAAQGITVTPAPLAASSLQANASVPVTFSISVPPSAQPGFYSGTIALNGQPAGAAAPYRLGRAFSFVFAVD